MIHAAISPAASSLKARKPDSNSSSAPAVVPITAAPDRPASNPLAALLNRNFGETLLPIVAVSTAILIASTSVGQSLWARLIDGWTHDQLFIYGTFIYSTILYWTPALLLSIPDLTHAPALIHSRKIQQTKSTSTRDFLKACRQVLFNQLLVNLPLLLLSPPVWRWNGCGSSVESLPAWWTILRDFAVFAVVEE
ncbi:Chromosome 5 4, partial [Irineochytrium annulatum]